MKYYLALILCGFMISACGSDVDRPIDNDPDDNPTDYCEVFGWYGDGKCDENCTNPDPDCESTTSCALPGDGFYVSEDAQECQVVRYACPEGMEGFSNDCGCGCIDAAPQICEILEDDENRNYYGFGDECALLDFVCEPGSEYFSDECGCGCEGFLQCEWFGEGSYYIGNAEECEEIRFDCPSNYEPFFSDCGCGCAPANECRRRDDVIYYGDNPEECSLEDVMAPCPENYQYFSDECGCGCEPDPNNFCPNPDDPGVWYASDDPDECLLIDFGCDANSTHFYDEICGCGCIEGCQSDFDCPNGFCDDIDCDAEFCVNECQQRYCGDGSEIACRQMEPICPAGETFSVINGCYGPCVDARTCM